MPDIAAKDHLDEDREESRQIAESMEALAANGEWEQIASLSARLRDSVTEVPEAERREVILTLQRSNDIVQSMVNKAREELKEQLSSLRRGKDAAKAYKQTDRMVNSP